MKLQVIVGSTRPGRVSDRVAEWTATELKKQDGVEVEIVDLADYDMPMFNEAISPQYNPDRHPEGIVKQWLDKLTEADGYAVVLPEYNRAMPSVLKNALDYIAFETKNKPMAIVAHGSTGGAQAVASMRIMAAGINVVTIPQATFLIGQAGNLLNEQGALTDELAANPHGPGAAIKTTADSLVWYAKALSAARG